VVCTLAKVTAEHSLGFSWDFGQNNFKNCISWVATTTISAFHGYPDSNHFVVPGNDQLSLIRSFIEIFWSSDIHSPTRSL
jgi:hypothetical protein